MQRVSVISVPVSNQETSKRFYTEQVGFKLLFEASFAEHLHWIQVGPGAGPSLTLVTWFDEMPAGSLRGLVLDCDDLEADYAAMSSRGVEFSGPPAQQPGGVFATFIDPDGNRVSLRQADSSIGEDEGLVQPTRRRRSRAANPMMSEIPDCTEVLVVGAGPVGLAVAASLAGHGHDVAREIKPPARPTAPGAPVSGNGSVGQSTGARQQMIMSS